MPGDAVYGRKMDLCWVFDDFDKNILFIFLHFIFLLALIAVWRVLCIYFLFINFLFWCLSRYGALVHFLYRDRFRAKGYGSFTFV